MKAKTNAFSAFGSGVAGLLLLLVIIGAVVVTLGNLRLRHDFTADKLYTLSDGSRRLLAGLPEDVTLKFFFNRSSPAVPMFVKSYARQVEDLLKEYALAAQGRIVVETYDPKADSDEEEWAQRYGIQPQPTGVMTPPIYFGIVAVSGEREETLPALTPQGEATLEYDLSRLVSRAATAVRPVIGVLSDLPVMGAPPMQPMMRPAAPQPWYAIQELQRDFEVRTVSRDAAAIEPGITTLLVIHPKNLPPKTLYAIDQFVMRGGRLVACVDPLSLADLKSQQQNQMAMMGMGGQNSSSLDPLFSAWGIGFEPGKLLADNRALTRVGNNGRVEESPVFLSLRAANMNRQDLLTAQLDQILMPYAGILSDATGDDIAFEPLISSSDAACRVDAQMAMFGAEALRGQLKPDGLRHVIAARLSGPFKSAYPEGAPAGDPAPEEGSEAPAAPAGGHLAACAEPNTMLVIADCDFLSDDVAVRQVEMMFGFRTLQAQGDNLAFLANAVEKLSGSAELAAIRSRGTSQRPFTRVDELEFRAMNAWRQEEENLSAELQQTQQQLNELQNRKQGSQKFILSKEQEEAIRRFQQKQADVKRQLKQVRRNLTRDIERLGVRVKILNIAGIPLLVTLFGIARGVLGRRSQ
jgi:ABC-type uncharacterized transport system involved in gliding motility auxiliary subunit